MNFIPLLNREFKNPITDMDWSIPNLNKQLNTRAKIDTGKFCNANCNFCYYGDQLNSKEFLIPEKAKEIGKYLINNGITEFELSGGEPTISKYFLDIIKTLNQLQIDNNIKPQISVVTNGYLFGQKQSQQLRIANEYINEWLISIHGYGNDHDKVVGTKGAFYNIDNFIYNYKDSKTLIRVNVVVTPDTIKQNHHETFIKFLVDLTLNDIQINFLPLNYWSNAKDKVTTFDDILDTYKFISKFFIAYGERPIIFQKNINKFIPLRSRRINIRYAQMCLLDRWAREYVVSHTDHIYDLHDWNKVFYPKDFLENQYTRPASEYYNLNDNSSKNFSKRKRIIKDLSFSSQLNAALRDQEQSHIKDGICTKCEYFLVCDGIKKEEYQLKENQDSTSSNYRKRFIQEMKNQKLERNYYE